jgi:hypothetical protein
MTHSPTLPAIERATIHLYQLYDVSDSIDLEAAADVLATATARMRPVASRGGNIAMPQLPLEMRMDAVTLTLGGQELRGRLHARIFDLGILSLRLMLTLPAHLTWETACDVMAEVQTVPPGVRMIFEDACDMLCEMLEPALQRPYATIRTEEYGILLIEQLGAGTSAAHLARHPMLLRAALGERRPLSEFAAQTLATSLSYYEDDLILITWTAALIIEPDASAREDATFLLEFANVQLLAFRSYDAQVERDLVRVTPRIARSRAPLVWSGATTRFLREIHALIADSTDANARVENALKVTEDVYWNRVYTAALAALRVDTWRLGITEGLAALREIAGMLNDEAEAARATLLEILVIGLILLELIVAVIGLHR